MKCVQSKIAIGVDDFKEIRENNYCYIDKSMLVHELLESGAKVTLFTRPRRFGKTLNMTMLREFFDCTTDSQNLFDDLLVARSISYQHVNEFPTVYFSFKDCKGEKEEIIANIYTTILKEYDKYSFLKEELSLAKKIRYEQIFETLAYLKLDKMIVVKDAIQFLTEVLYSYYNKKVMLLIDEYDTPLESARIGGFYEEIHTFISGLYASALKGNACLKQGILTGIQRIAKENIFSGLNNLIVESVVDSDFNEYFGFTEEETSDLLQSHGLQLVIEVKEMYNGYNFGGKAIYNPWSILNYIKAKKLNAYWVNTASNGMIKKLILEHKNQPEFKEGFETLLINGIADVRLDMTASYLEEPQVATLWALLLNAGYITLDQISYSIGRVTIRIPNKEVKEAFRNVMVEYTALHENALSDLFYYLIEKNDIEAFKKIYQKMVYTSTSYYDAKENAYHMLFLGMCMYLDGYYEVKSNIETGDGRSDIVLKALKSGYNHFVIEFKQGENLQVLATEAIRQIEDKHYSIGVEGKVVLIGVAHNKKTCEIVSKEISS